MNTMYEDFQELEYRRSASGLYVPLGKWQDLNEAIAYGEQLGKARVRTPEEEKMHQMYRKMGTLMSTLYQSVAYNLSAYGASDKPPGTVSHRMLRETVKRSVIDSAIINARMHQVRHVARRIVVEGKQKGFTVRHKLYSDPSFQNTPAVKRMAQEIEDCLFKKINRDVHGSGGFKDFMVKAVQDQMIIDRKCFPYNTTLETDQGPMWIGTIVQQRLPVKIKSIDLQTGATVWGQITDWQVVKHVTEWVKLAYRAGERWRSLIVTPDHEVWTQRGMVPAGTLTLQDSIYASAMRLSAEQEQVILGGLLGDMYFLHRGRSLPSLKVTRTRKHEAAREYFDWQVRNFSQFAPSIYNREMRAVAGEDKWHSATEMQTQSSPAFLPYLTLCRCDDGKRRITWEWMSKIEALGLATWIMDDASFARTNQSKNYPTGKGGSMVCNLSIWVDEEEKQIVERYFSEKWRLSPYWCKNVQESVSDTTKQKWSIQFRVEETRKLLEIISPYVQPCLDEEWVHGEGRKRWIAKDIPQGTEGMVPIPLRSIKRRKAPPGQRVAYDVTVEPTHTIVAHRIVTSNCMVIMRDRRNRPLSYHLLPPDDIKPRLEVIMKFLPVVTSQGGRGAMGLPRYTADDFSRARDSIFDKFGVDVTDAAYVQEVDNIITGAWTVEECSVDITAPTNELNLGFYGVSCLERSLEISALLIQAFDQNKEIFNQEMPDVFLMLHGEVDQSGLEAFKRKIKAEGKRTRVGVMATGDGENKADILKVRDTPREMEMPQMIRLFSSIKCASYRAHPSLINLNPDRGTDRAVIASYNDAFEINLAQEEGLGSLLEDQAFWLTRELVEPTPEWEEYEVVADLPKEQSEKEQLEIWTEKSGNLCTVDTALAALGLPSLAEQTDGRVRGDYVNNNFFFQAQQAQQQEMQQNLQSLFAGGPQFDEGESDWTMGEDAGNLSPSPEQGWT